MRTLDRIDKQILEELTQNPTQPFLKIAKKINVASSTVKERYEKMKGTVFTGPFAILDLSKIGFQGRALLMINYSDERNQELTLSKVKKLPNAFLIIEAVGKFDLIVQLMFRDVKEVKTVVNEIRALPGVKKVDVAITEQTDFPTRREYTTST